MIYNNMHKCYNKKFCQMNIMLTMYIYIGAVEYYHYNDFLDAVEAYELDLEDNRIKAASDIVKKVKIYSS